MKVKLSYLDLVQEDQVIGADHIHCLFKRPTMQNKTKIEERKHKRLNKRKNKTKLNRSANKSIMLYDFCQI